MPEWAWGIVLGIIISLIGVIQGLFNARLNSVEHWRLDMPTTKEILTVADHHKICKAISVITRFSAILMLKMHLFKIVHSEKRIGMILNKIKIKT